ncbi:MAG: hypothetical protein MK085_09085 [Phycisphaerales bacterium]|nr:hypothetical protein [Phycisphaerales bacterium]
MRKSHRRHATGKPVRAAPEIEHVVRGVPGKGDQWQGHQQQQPAVQATSTAFEFQGHARKHHQQRVKEKTRSRANARVEERHGEWIHVEDAIRHNGHQQPDHGHARNGPGQDQSSS